MMKSCEAVIIVDSVEEAVKFYTEKMAFDIADLLVSNEGIKNLSLARLRKGKCFIIFRTPIVEELAEFSYIKRCVSRCVCLQVEMKKGIDKYFDRCNKKGVKFSTELKDCEEMGMRIFSIRDPFGIKVIVTQPLANKTAAKISECCGIQMSSNQSADQIIDRLKDFGILRRFAKKFAKAKIKEFSK